MSKHRIKLNDLRRILASYGVNESPNRGKGGHTLFWKEFSEGRFSFPVPNRKDVLPCYVKGARRKFHLMPEDGVSDDEFFDR